MLNLSVILFLFLNLDIAKDDQVLIYREIIIPLFEISLSKSMA